MDKSKLKILLISILYFVCFEASYSQLLKINAFDFGYYLQRSNLKSLSYSDLFNTFELKNQLPSIEQYNELENELSLNLSGIYFGFEAQINTPNSKENPRSSVGLNFRNGFYRTNRFVVSDSKNEIFNLESTNTNGEFSNYSIKLKSEIFSVGLSYFFALINQNNFQFYLGVNSWFDIPISTKLYALAYNENDVFSGTFSNQDYFMKNDLDFSFAPLARATIKVGNSTHVKVQYNYGVHIFSLEGNNTYGNASLLQLGLNIKV